VKDFSSGVFNLVVSKKFQLGEWKDALEFYKENMSKGKVLLHP